MLERGCQGIATRLYRRLIVPTYELDKSIAQPRWSRQAMGCARLQTQRRLQCAPLEGELAEQQCFPLYSLLRGSAGNFLHPLCREILAGAAITKYNNPHFLLLARFHVHVLCTSQCCDTGRYTLTLPYFRPLTRYAGLVQNLHPFGDRHSRPWESESRRYSNNPGPYDDTWRPDTTGDYRDNFILYCGPNSDPPRPIFDRDGPERD